MWDLIILVPDHCLYFYFNILSSAISFSVGHVEASVTYINRTYYESFRLKEFNPNFFGLEPDFGDI